MCVGARSSDAHSIQLRQAVTKTVHLALDDLLLLLEGALPHPKTLVSDLPFSELAQPLLRLAVGQQVRQRVGEGLEVRHELLTGPAALQCFLVRLLDP